MTLGPGIAATPKGGGRKSAIGPDRFFLKDAVVHDDDRFAVIEYVGAAGVPGPPAHRHTTFEEAWFILDGKVEFWDGQRTIEIGSGSYLRVPPGVPHTFKVVGTKPARWVGIFSPGRYVRLLEELSRVIPANGPPNPEQIKELFSRYDTELVPGPTAARPRTSRGR